MTGPVEEAGKVAGGIVDALKAQPAVLALMVANIGMLVFLFYALAGAAKFRETMLSNQYELMKETQVLLSKCVVPDKSSILFKKMSNQEWHLPPKRKGHEMSNEAQLELHLTDPKPAPPPPPKPEVVPPPPNTDAPPTIVVPPGQR